MPSSNPFLQHFPHTATIKQPRQIQIDCLEWLWQNFPNSKKFQICAPVGCGKSALAIAVFNYVKSLGMHGLYTSPLNILVDQVDREFRDVVTLKGRKYYPCLSGKDNCAHGFCQDDKCAKGLDTRKCEYAAECKTCGCPKCVYRIVFKAFQGSHIGNTNFTMFLLGIDNSPEVLVIDEGDDIEGFTRMHYSLTVDGHISTDFEKAIEELKLKADVLITLLSDDEQKQDIRKKQKEELDKIDRILLDYEEHHEPYVITNYINRKGLPKSKIEPITTERFISPLLSDKIVIMMSATLSKQEGWEYLETPSPFPVDIRRWQYLPLGRMSLKYRNQTLPKVAEWMTSLKGKTLVHCVSYETASYLGELLKAHHVYPLLQTNDLDDVDEDTYMRYDIVQAFKTAKDPDKILLSVKLERGTDFPEPEIINNVILAVPFPNPTDPLTKAKNNTIGLSWQDSQIAKTIEQSYGRINRNADKTTMTTIVDSNFNNLELGYWYLKNKKYFHNWFIEAESGYNALLYKICNEQNLISKK